MPKKLTSELESVFPSSFPLLENVCIFQIVHNLVNDGLWKTPLHVALSQTTHDICKSKRLITIINRLGLCSNYHDLARIDTGPAKHTIALAGLHRVPIPPSILPGSSIHGATDNFDHEEHTLSGIGGSYDTILLFQKKWQSIWRPRSSCVLYKTSIGAEEKLSKSRRHHELITTEVCKYSDCATIRSSFISTLQIDWSNTIGTSGELYRLWVHFRHTKDPNRIQNIPSFAATNSILLWWRKSG